MTTLLWHEEPIKKSHDRKNFDCGQPELNGFLANYARQAHESGASKTYVAVDRLDGKTVFGFYTLCPTEMQFDEVPSEAQPRNAGRHPIAAIRLARIAVAQFYQGEGVGGALLLSAARRCIRASTEIGGSILVIDAKDDRAAAWYRNYGALEIPARPLCLVLPYDTLKAVMKQAGIEL